MARFRYLENTRWRLFYTCKKKSYKLKSKLIRLVPVGLLKTNSMCIKAWAKLCLLYLYSFLISVLILPQTHAKPMEVLIILCVPCICACLVCMFMEEIWDHCKAPWPKQDEMDETYLKTKFKTMGFVFVMECLCWPTISCIIIFFFLFFGNICILSQIFLLLGLSHEKKWNCWDCLVLIETLFFPFRHFPKCVYLKLQPIWVPFLSG